jgi:hypothetical protein
MILLKRSHHDPLVYEASVEALPKDGRYTFRAFLKGETKKLQEVEAESKPVRFERISVKDKEATPTPEPVKEPVPEQKNSKLPILQIVLITVANLVAVGVGFVMTKRARTGAAANPSKYIPPKQVLEAIAGLEEKVIVNPDVAGETAADSAAEKGASAEGKVAPAAAEAAQPMDDGATPSTGSETEQAEAEGLADAVGALSDDVVNASEGAGEGESNGPAAAAEEPKEG